MSFTPEASMPRLSALLTAITLLLVGPVDRVNATDASQTIQVGPFHKVRVDGNAEVTLRAGDAESVTVRGSEYQSRDVRVAIEVQEGELRIRTRPEGGSWWSD